MEESKTRSRHLSRRTQLLSAAATIAVIVAVAGAVIVSSSNGDNKKVKTVEEKKKETTQTTIPLTKKEQLIADSYLLKRDPDINVNNYDNYLPQLFSTKTGELVKDFSDKEIGELSNLKISGGHLIANYGPAGAECEGDEQVDPTLDINLSDLTFEKVENGRRVWSPDGTKFALLSVGCGLYSSDLVITDAKTGNKTTFKKVISGNLPKSEAGYDFDVFSKKGVSEIFWIDNSKLLVDIDDSIYVTDSGASMSDGPGKADGWHTLDLSTDDSLNDVKEVPERFCCNWDDGMKIYDVRTVDGKTLVLGTFVYEKDDWINDVVVLDLANGDILWTKKFDVPNYEGTKGLQFGKTTNEVFGWIGNPTDAEPFGQTAFGYDHESDTTVLPEGGILIPRFR